MNRIGSFRLSERFSVNYHHRSSRYDLTSHVMIVDNKRMLDLTSKWFVADGTRLFDHISWRPKTNSHQAPEASYYRAYVPTLVPLVRDLTTDLTAPVAIELIRLTRTPSPQEDYYAKEFGTFGDSNTFVKSAIYFMNEADAVQAGVRWCEL